MEKHIQVFNNTEFGEIRTMEINGEPWFVGKDIATALGYAKPGNALGITAAKVGRLANAHGLKTDEYGITVMDKSRYSSKEVASFRYNEKGKARIAEIIKEGTT